MNRRTLLATLASLPLCGWVRPKARNAAPLKFRFLTQSIVVSVTYRDANGVLRTIEMQQPALVSWREHAVEAPITHQA